MWCVETAALPGLRFRLGPPSVTWPLLANSKTTVLSPKLLTPMVNVLDFLTVAQMTPL